MGKQLPIFWDMTVRQQTLEEEHTFQCVLEYFIRETVNQQVELKAKSYVRHRSKKQKILAHSEMQR